MFGAWDSKDEIRCGHTYLVLFIVLILTANSTRFVVLVFLSIDEMWSLTVWSLIPSSRPISLLVKPSTKKLSTADSRLVMFNTRLPVLALWGY